MPLIEIVSEPDLRTPDEAVAYLKAVRDILVYLEICDGNMQEGSLRCDANVSIRPVGEKKLGTKAELKNMNSFKFLKDAVAYETTRQIEVLESGEKVIQETRLFDPSKGVTRSMRSKEEAHDYRYFPEPDLLPLIVEEKEVSEIKKTLPELPQEKREIHKRLLYSVLRRGSFNRREGGCGFLRGMRQKILTSLRPSRTGSWENYSSSLTKTAFR